MMCAVCKTIHLKLLWYPLSGYIFSLFTKNEMLASGSGKEVDGGFFLGTQNNLNQNHQEDDSFFGGKLSGVISR